MAKQIDYRLLVKVEPNSGLSVSTILSEPRQATPMDVLNASRTLTFEVEGEEIPKHLKTFAEFIVRDFFVIAQRTGLYNRQRSLWQAGGRVTSIGLTRTAISKTLMEGFENPLTLFNKVNAPYVDFSFYDGRAKLLIWATLLDQPPPKEKFKSEKAYARAIENFLYLALKRAQLAKKREPTLQGIFIGLPDQVPNTVLKLMEKITEATDPTKRFEALLPLPMAIPANIVGTTFGGEDASDLIAHVVYPPLKALQLKTEKDSPTKG